MAKQKILAAPSIRRLPSYLHVIKEAAEKNIEYISATVIAEEFKLEPIQVRKDLAITGITGKPKKGFPVEELIRSIENFLGWNKENRAILVGAGNLGTALSGYPGFFEHGLKISAAFDTDKEKIGKEIHGVPIFDFAEIENKIKELNPVIAILTVPSQHAQEVTDNLVKLGIKAIWNFTNLKLNVPDSVKVQKEDLSSGYAMLGVMINNKKWHNG